MKPVKTPRRRTLALVAVALLAGACSEWKRFAYEGFDRDSWQQPERVVTELGLRPGDRVADLGAGGGYFTFRLAEAVGPTGRVFAVDVDEDMLAYLEERVAEEGHENVTVVRAGFDDPNLPDAGVDLLFTSNTYHHLEERTAYFQRVLVDLRPGGRVAILEFDGSAGFAKWFAHATSRDTIVAELEAAGYALDRELGFIDRQSFLIFRRASP